MNKIVRGAGLVKGDQALVFRQWFDALADGRRTKKDCTKGRHRSGLRLERDAHQRNDPHNQPANRAGWNSVNRDLSRASGV